MEICFALTTNGDWPGTVRMAQQAEAAGFDGVVWADHLLGNPRGTPMLEGWTVLSALGAVTSRVQVGILVLNNMFRNPGLLAKMATALDLVTNGRLRFLIGTGWMSAEHRQYGFDFPSGGHRVELLEDAVMRGLWDSHGQPFTYEGRHASVRECINIPFPQRRIPIGIATSGKRCLGLTARLADEWSCPSTAMKSLAELSSAVDENLGGVGRDRRALRRSVTITYTVGEISPGPDPFNTRLGLHGSTQQMVDRAGEWARIGITTAYLHAGYSQAAFEAVARALPALHKVG